MTRCPHRQIGTLSNRRQVKFGIQNNFNITNSIMIEMNGINYLFISYSWLDGMVSNLSNRYLIMSQTSEIRHTEQCRYRKLIHERIY